MPRVANKTTRKEIPKTQRVLVICLRHQQGLTFTEIARIVRIKVDTAKGIWQRAVSRAGNKEDLLSLCDTVNDLPRRGRPRREETDAPTAEPAPAPSAAVAEKFPHLPLGVPLGVRMNVEHGPQPTEDNLAVSSKSADDTGDSSTSSHVHEARMTEGSLAALLDSNSGDSSSSSRVTEAASPRISQPSPSTCLSPSPNPEEEVSISSLSSAVSETANPPVILGPTRITASVDKASTLPQSSNLPQRSSPSGLASRRVLTEVANTPRAIMPRPTNAARRLLPFSHPDFGRVFIAPNHAVANTRKSRTRDPA